MTQNELRDFILSLTKTICDKKGYIKGYGMLYRVMDGDHNPLMNITKSQMDVLKHNGVIFQDGLVFKLNDFNPPFKHASEIKLPSRTEII